MVRLLLFALLCAALTLTACGSASPEHASSKKGYDYYKAQSDLQSAGTPCTIRCTVQPDQPLPGQVVDHWEWDVNGGSVIRKSADGREIYVAMDHQGECTYQARGVDNKGRDCTTPRGHFSSRRNTNAPPVVTDFDGPQGPYPGFETGDDGTVRRYHEWRWRNAQGYDPEDSAQGIEISSWSWGVYAGPDTDGDGPEDTLLAWKNADGTMGSTIPGQLMIRESPTRNSFAVRVYQLSEDDQEVHIIVTVTDSAAKPRKWGDGHVTLMK